MAHLSAENRQKAEAVVAVYPQPRSALIPLCHLAQAQDGYLTEEAMEDIARLCDVSPAEVRGTASFYDMLHTEPVGRYVVAVCTNIACMLAGAYEVLGHAKQRLGIHVGQTTPDGLFTLEEAECLAGCDQAVCVQVNHRFFGPLDEEAFDRLVDDLAAGRLEDTVPRHGVLSRVSRAVGLPAATPVAATISNEPQAAGTPPPGEKEVAPEPPAAAGAGEGE
ncbi:MAG TPA: NAD(P)H-dependent oxidoreductase subunit E [Acidimicrobiales bacterium]|nr:NAD(P)H-dependent oxidoreductase subunit E [Acidimicrobiales bacterium]